MRTNLTPIDATGRPLDLPPPAVDPERETTSRDLLALNALGRRHQIVLFGSDASTAADARTPAAAILIQYRDLYQEARALIPEARNPRERMSCIRSAQRILKDMWTMIADVARMKLQAEQHERDLAHMREALRARLAGPDPARHTVTIPISHPAIVTNPGLAEAMRRD